MPSIKQQTMAKTARTATEQETSRLTQATTLAFGAAGFSVVSAYGFLFEPTWSDGKMPMLAMMPLLLVAGSVVIILRPQGNGPVHVTGSVVAEAQNLPEYIRPVMAPEHASLGGTRQAQFNDDLAWHKNMQSKLNGVLWSSYLVCLTSLGAVFALWYYAS